MCVVLLCENVFVIVGESERVYTCAREILVSVSSLSLSLLSLRNQNYPWIVSECFSMSICESATSNLSRSFSFRSSATDRFDTMMPGVALFWTDFSGQLHE